MALFQFPRSATSQNRHDYVATERLYLSKDGKVVKHDDPSKDSLLVAVGGHLSKVDAVRYGLIVEPEMAGNQVGGEVSGVGGSEGIAEIPAHTTSPPQSSVVGSALEIVDEGQVELSSVAKPEPPRRGRPPKVQGVG